MFVGGPCEGVREERDGGVHHGHAQRLRAARARVRAARVVLQRARAARAQRRHQLRTRNVFIISFVRKLTRNSVKVTP